MLVVTLTCVVVFCALFWTVKHSRQSSSPHHQLAVKSTPWVFIASAALLISALKYGWSISLSAIALILAMLLAIAGMHKCAQRNTVFAKVTAVFLLLVVVASGATLMRFNYSQDSLLPDIKVQDYERIRGLIMGQAMAEFYPDSRVLIVTGWDSENEQIAKTQIEGLKEGLGPKFEPLELEKVEIQRNKWNHKPSMKLNADGFDKLVAKYPRCNLIVSTIGLPWDVEKMKLWDIDDAERPKVAILDGEIFKLGKAVKDGFISVIITYLPGWTYTPTMPKDPRQACDSRFLFITADNVESISKANRLFR